MHVRGQDGRKQASTVDKRFGKSLGIAAPNRRDESPNRRRDAVVFRLVRGQHMGSSPKWYKGALFRRKCSRFLGV
jgi:hypothetical protein